jgi:hypothetical protein
LWLAVTIRALIKRESSSEKEEKEKDRRSSSTLGRTGKDEYGVREAKTIPSSLILQPKREQSDQYSIPPKVSTRRFPALP